MCSSSETLVSVNGIVQRFVHPGRILSCEMSGSYLIDLWMAMNVGVSLLDDDDFRGSLFYRIGNRRPFHDPNSRSLKILKAISNCK